MHDHEGKRVADVALVRNARFNRLCLPSGPIVYGSTWIEDARAAFAEHALGYYEVDMQPHYRHNRLTLAQAAEEAQPKIWESVEANLTNQKPLYIVRLFARPKDN